MNKRKCFSKWVGELASTCESRVGSVQLGPYQSRETWEMCFGHEMMDNWVSLKWWMTRAGENIRKTICCRLGSLEADTKMRWSLEFKICIRDENLWSKSRASGIGQREKLNCDTSWQSPSKRPGVLEPLFSIRTSWIRPEWIGQRFLTRSSRLAGLHHGLASLLQLRLTLKSLTSRGCLWTTLPTARH